MTKKEARETMKILRSKLSPSEREQKNQAIFRRLMQMDVMKQARWFFPFVSYGTEVDTIEMIKYILESKLTRVAVPRVHGNHMDFFEITSMEQLVSGYHGILEPNTTNLIQARDGVMLLPGLAFDLDKNRVGYGAGYYDRYLEQYQNKNLITIAIAYDFQIVDSITADTFDQKPNLLITDKGVI